MRIAIISDTHDNIWQLQKAYPHIAAADVLLHCGDIISPFMIPRLAEAAQGKPVHLVWGNNDGDKRLLSQMAARAKNVHIHGDFAHLTLDGLSVAVNHYPEIARPLAASGEFDLVCYGHDHTAHEEYIGKTLLLNPGEVMGLNGRSTMVLFDTGEKNVVWMELT